ncbi:ATP-binding cassette domain-containing protein [Nonomuraea basaltis]|nr:ATP-binding cassette domain-containing protein [Nonomuraea basaltis]
MPTDDFPTDHLSSGTAPEDVPAAGDTSQPRVPEPGAGENKSMRACRTALQSVPHEPGAAKPDPVVIVNGIRRTFGGLTAVDVEHLEIQRGVITALIGPNGAGKTTFFNLLTGFDQPDAGSWSFDGTPLISKAAYKVARLGMVRTFQLTRVLSKLTVLENMGTVRFSV